MLGIMNTVIIIFLKRLRSSADFEIFLFYITTWPVLFFSPSTLYY